MNTKNLLKTSPNQTMILTALNRDTSLAQIVNETTQEFDVNPGKEAPLFHIIETTL